MSVTDLISPQRRLSVPYHAELSSGYGEGALMMGVEPVNTAVETLPVPRIRFLRVKALMA